MTENDSIEKEFEDLVNAHKAEIQAKVTEASKVLDEAVALSEKYGIPFYAQVSFLSQSYTPDSYYEKFGDLDKDTVNDLTDCYPGGEWGGSGWEHSAVC